MDKVPKEILLLILQYLPYADLKRSLLTSKRFLDGGSESCLWRDFELLISNRNIDSLPQLLELERMKHLESVKFVGCKIKNKHLKLISATKVSRVQVGDCHDIEKDCQVSDVTPSILASLVGNLESFKFQNSLLSEMSPKQIKFLAKRLEMSSNLRQLEIFYDNSLTSLPVDSLSLALASLTQVSLVFQKLNPNKYNAIFSRIILGSNLKVVNLQGNNLSNVNPEIFGPAITRLDTANLSDCKISSAMFNALFNNMKGDFSLKHLDISHNSALKHIDDYVFGDAINQLEKVNLKFTSLTVFQLMNLFELMQVQTMLEEMNLVGNLSLAKIPQNLFARTMTKLTKITIYATKLTSTQINSLLSHIVNQPSDLKFLDLGGNNLSSISPALLAKSVSKLETVILFLAKLSTDQQDSILREALKGSKLRYLDLGGNMLRISEELLEECPVCLMSQLEL